MTYINSTNNTNINGSQAMYTLKATLVTAGWTVQNSSDGISYSAGVDKWLSGSSGANGVANGNAWVRLKQPGSGNREFLIQRGSNTSWVVLYAVTGGFTGVANGAISASVAPTATTASEGKAIVGTTGGSANATTIFQTDNAYNLSVIANNAAPYEWYMASFLGTGAPSGLFFDAMISGTYNASDGDPYVIGGGSTMYNATDLGLISSGNNYSFCWMKYGIVGAAFSTAQGISYQIANIGLQFIGTDPISGGEILIPLSWGRTSSQTAPFGWKGTSTLFRLCLSSRTIKDTISVATSTSREYICLQTASNLYAIWDGSLPA